MSDWYNGHATSPFSERSIDNFLDIEILSPMPVSFADTKHTVSTVQADFPKNWWICDAIKTVVLSKLIDCLFEHLY